MTAEHAIATPEPDPAAVFAIALSLWEGCEKSRRENDWNLSDCYNGYDQLMREIMRIANQFENWSCSHVNFDELGEVWPYYLGDKFGDACLSILGIERLMDFSEEDCLRIALALNLPVISDGIMPVPVDLTAPNPIAGAGFRQFRIQTVRDSVDDRQPSPYVVGDEPFDEEFCEPYFSLYGVDATELLEHIADRNSYGEILQLVRRLAPGIAFPLLPSSPT
jgi:hypothetical protein